MYYKSKHIYLIVVATIVGIVIGTFLNYPLGVDSIFNQNKQDAKIKRLMNFIQHDYVDAIDSEELLDKTIDQVLSNLDPHSVYIPKSEVSDIQETMNGSFKGIGIQFRMINDSLTVLKVLPDGPSEKAGLKAGDRILIADQDTLYGKNYTSTEVMQFLKSDKTTPVSLSVFRRNTNGLLTFNFKRGDVKTKSINVYHMLNNSIGYIKIELFSRTTYDEFMTALSVLKAQGMTSLILDLRNNTGGFLDIANDILDEFLPDGTLMVYTISKSGRKTESYATKKGAFEKGNLYVLINEESASASEIVAGAIQDTDRGIIVGRRSFGKGLVQQEMDLGDGSVVRLTIARYYTPTGRSIQKPYDHDGNGDYFQDTEDRFTNGEFFYKDSMPIVDSLKYTTPKGKIVYGGGGIIPDVFIPLDTTFQLSVLFFQRINDVIFDYVDYHRNELNQLDLSAFKNGFDVTPIVTLLNTDHDFDILNNEEQAYFKWYLKALVARELFGENAFYQIYLEKDPMVIKVLEEASKNVN